MDPDVNVPARIARVTVVVCVHVLDVQEKTNVHVAPSVCVLKTAVRHVPNLVPLAVSIQHIHKCHKIIIIVLFIIIRV